MAGARALCQLQEEGLWIPPTAPGLWVGSEYSSLPGAPAAQGNGSDLPRRPVAWRLRVVPPGRRDPSHLSFASDCRFRPDSFDVHIERFGGVAFTGPAK